MTIVVPCDRPHHHHVHSDKLVFLAATSRNFLWRSSLTLTSKRLRVLKLPTTAHVGLIKAGTLPDPYKDLTDRDMQCGVVRVLDLSDILSSRRGFKEQAGVS